MRDPPILPSRIPVVPPMRPPISLKRRAEFETVWLALIKDMTLAIILKTLKIELWEMNQYSLHDTWHGPTLYSGHLQKPMLLRPIIERLAMKLSLPVLTSKVWVLDSNTQPSACVANGLTDSANAGGMAMNVEYKSKFEAIFR